MTKQIYLQVTTNLYSNVIGWYNISAYKLVGQKGVMDLPFLEAHASYKTPQVSDIYFVFQMFLSTDIRFTVIGGCGGDW